MEQTTMTALLYCENCNGETDHTITYRNGKICSIGCQVCGAEVHLDHQSMSHYYKEEVLNRLLTKPGRMTREMQADLNGFLRSMPKRVITKPYRVYKELEKKH